MDATAFNSSPLLADSARRERAKRQLYVACQLVGWGVFFALQLFFTLAFPDPSRPLEPVRIVSLQGMFAAFGLLLSHSARSFITRRRWIHFGWKQLLPRILLASIVLSFLWIALVFGYKYGVLQEEWTSKYAPRLTFTLSTVNGAFLYLTWFCLYFFYQLFDRFNRLEVERLSLVASVKEAELRALKSQVNPHFIFNALNSLRALIEEDPARARQAVTQLANLLRYSLQSGQLETVPLDDELRVVNDYLALEQVRHEERLRLRLDIASDTLHLPIPPMLLQTLVENAVKYGISASPDGGEIAIITRREAGGLHLQVTNPGEIAPASQAKPSKSAAVSTGVGLRNAADRLRLLFGDSASLQLRSLTPQVVVAEAHIPLQPSKAPAA